MADNRQRLVHLHTSDVKMPAQGLLDLGEIAVQHNDVEAALYIEKNNGEIAKFIDVTAVEAKIEVEKLRAEGAEEALADKIETLEGSNHTHENKGVLDGITAEKVAAWDAAEANAIADAEAKYQVKGEYEAAGAAEAALEAAKADAADKYQVKGEYEAAGAAAQALADAKADAEAKYQVKGEYEVAGAAAQALADAKADAADKYQVKGEYEVAGAADTALEAAKSYSDGNLATAKAYVDGKVDGKFDEVGAAAQALTDAKTYTDEKLSVIKIDCGTY